MINRSWQSDGGDGQLSKGLRKGKKSSGDKLWPEAPLFEWSTARARVQPMTCELCAVSKITGLLEFYPRKSFSIDALTFRSVIKI